MNLRRKIIFLSIALAPAVALLAAGDALAASWRQDNSGRYFGQGYAPYPKRYNDYGGRYRSGNPYLFPRGQSFFWQPYQPVRPFVRKPPRVYANDYRTLCVRTCDGYYFPISYATSRRRFKTDAAVCKSLYPPGEAALYVHRTTGEDATQAVSLAGTPLVKESFAFAYRSTYDHVCAGLFRSGSGAMISFTKRPVPKRGVASLATAIAVPRRGKPSRLPDVAMAEATSISVDLGLESLESPGDRHVSADGGMRTVGPAYYYDPSHLSSTGGEPAKLARQDLSDPTAVSTVAPVTASILPNPLDLLRSYMHGAPPDSEPAERVD